MANIFNVARYILYKEGNMTAMKLEKLCYYSQVWHLAWEEQPLYNNIIQAWENGPVSPDLYDWHRGQFIVSHNRTLDNLCDNENELLDNERESIDCVLRDYKNYTAQQLSELTHKERPWRDVYFGNRDYSGRCNTVIPINLMHEYYSGLLDEND